MSLSRDSKRLVISIIAWFLFTTGFAHADGHPVMYDGFDLQLNYFYVSVVTWFLVAFHYEQKEHSRLYGNHKKTVTH
jgi:hypothetical protein